MRHTTTSRLKDIIKIHQGTGSYGFCIGEMDFRFKRSEDMERALGRVVKLEIVGGRDWDVEEALLDSDAQDQMEIDFNQKIEDGEADACTCGSCLNNG